MDEKPPSSAPWDAFGTYLRNQRQLAQLSLRQLADLTKVSNPYLSQIERGLHQPSIAIIKSLAEALHLSTSDLLAQAADIAADEQPTTSTEGAIRNDPLLNEAQRNALLAVYRSMVDSAPDAPDAPDATAAPDAPDAPDASAAPDAAAGPTAPPPDIDRPPKRPPAARTRSQSPPNSTSATDPRKT